MSARGTGLGIAAAFALASCTPTTPLVEPPQTPSSTATPTPTTTETTLYFLLGSHGRLYVSPERQVVGGADLVRARIEALMGSLPADPDLSTAFPAGVEVRAVTVSGSVATVDFGASVLEAEVDARLEPFAVQQIAWTLADAIGVEDVRFIVEGRSDGEASNGRSIAGWWGNSSIDDLDGTPDPFALAPITIDEPREEAEVSGRVLVSGDATVFEATVTLRLRDPSGVIVQETFATASIGAPGRGGWSTSLTFPDSAIPGTWTIEAVEVSAEDGADAFVQTRRVQVS